MPESWVVTEISNSAVLREFRGASSGRKSAETVACELAIGKSFKRRESGEISGGKQRVGSPLQTKPQ